MALNLFKKKSKEEDEIFAVFPEEIYRAGELALRDVLSPSALEINPTYVRLGAKLARTIFVFSYPRFLHTNWASPVINMDRIFDISMYVHPVDTSAILKTLRRKVAQVQSQISEREQKGLIRDPILDTAYRDLEELRDKLQQAQERLFNFGFYITVYGFTEEELNKTETEIKNLLEARLVYTKPALFQQGEGFQSALPLNTDSLSIHTYLNSSPISSTFPFVSFDLTSNKGILYGINRHNNSLILFDRFSLSNFNSVTFGVAGSGKSIRGNENVLVNNNGIVELLPIGTLIEKLIQEYGINYTDDELEGVENPKLQVFTFNQTLKGEWGRVRVAARKKAPDIFYRFTTQSGRSITTTGDHNMVTLKNGEVTVIKSSEVEAGEYIPLPRSIPVSPKPTRILNLLSLMRQSTWIYVKGADYLIKQYAQKLKGATINPAHDRYLYKYRGGTRIPLQYFNQLMSFLNLNIDADGFNTLRITACKGKSVLPAHLEVTESLMKILGYIVAEGTITKHAILISNTDKEVLADIAACLTNLGTLFFKIPGGIAIGERPFVELVKHLGINGKSAKKQVPPFIYNLDDKYVAAFLAAYFEGDGGVETNDIAAVSKSPQLISELSYLLLCFGIVGRMQKVKKKSPQMRKKRVYWRLMISGQNNLRGFSEKINFISWRKKAGCNELLTKSWNTNVDVIPQVNTLLQELYTLCHPYLCGIKGIDDARRGYRRPSRTMLQRITHRIETQLEKLKQLAITLQPLRELPSLPSLIAAGGGNSLFNRTLWQELATSWALIKNRSVRPRFENVNRVMQIVHQRAYSLTTVKNIVREGFKELGLVLKHHNPSLHAALINPYENNSYELIWEAAQFLLGKYQERIANLTVIEEKLSHLKTLAVSDLFWDPIIKVEKITNKKDKYVYDLTVDNGVFLAGKGGLFVHNSYLNKLEILRSLMWGTDVIVIDPEREYEYLSQVTGGSYVNISLTSKNHINPFDLPVPREDESPADVLRSNIVNLIGLFRLMLGGLTPEEDAILDQAITETYASRDITPESDFSKISPPTLSDLELVLASTAGGENLAMRLKKYTTGTWAGFINQPTNIEMNNRLVVFSVRDMEDELRPIGIFLVLRYIWNTVRSVLKKRLLVVDEAWWLMKNEDGASFLFGVAKRARKYYLGLSTITQDVGDFLNSPYGKPLITNSSLQVLLKQSPATIGVVVDTFNLTEEEKFLLLEGEKGEGIFFAGLKHVAIKVIASYTEDQIITSDPAQLLLIKKAKAEYAKQNA